MHSLIRQASGLYVLELRPRRLIDPLPATDTEDSWARYLPVIRLWPFNTSWRMELRLDVDGLYPQNVASITTKTDLGHTHWVAQLDEHPEPWVWEGPVKERFGDPLPIQVTDVRIAVFTPPGSSSLQAKLTMITASVGKPQFLLDFKSWFFRHVEMEVDFTTGGKPPDLVVSPYKLDDRSSEEVGVPESLSLEQVYERAGVSVALQEAADPCDSTLVQEGQTSEKPWTEDELNAALQKFWDAKSDLPKWALWLFYGKAYDWPTSTLGIMFDIETPERQGTAVFKEPFDTYYATGVVPEGQSADEWRQRSRFYVGVHESGHGFNLHHCWDPVQWSPHFPLPTSEDARTWMNYPWRIPDGATKIEAEEIFYKAFFWRFTDPELIFLRHAPEMFVQMGHEWWTSGDLGDPYAMQSTTEELELHVSLGRAEPVVQFLEPSYLDVILRSHSQRPRWLDPGLLGGGDSLILVITKEGRDSRVHVPFSRRHEMPVELIAGKPVAASIFVSAGRDGWYLSEPGTYTIQARLDLFGERIVSKPLRLRILRPSNTREEIFALDYFTKDMGRALYYRGTHSQTYAHCMQRLQEMTTDAELKDNPAAIHARFALNRVRGTWHHEMVFPRGASRVDELFAGRRLVLHPPEDHVGATESLARMLLQDAKPSHFGYVEYAHRCFWWARQLQTTALDPSQTEVIQHLRKIMSGDQFSPLLTSVAERWPSRPKDDLRDSR